MQRLATIKVFFFTGSNKKNTNGAHFSSLKIDFFLDFVIVKELDVDPGKDDDSSPMSY